MREVLEADLEAIIDFAGRARDPATPTLSALGLLHRVEERLDSARGQLSLQAELDDRQTAFAGKEKP
jgi:hypothetical protein